MELYAEYIKEIGSRELKYTDDYFFTYKVEDSHVYLEDVFIRKEKRNEGIINMILDDIYGIAKEKGFKYVTSSICTNSSDTVKSRSNHILTKNSFKEYESDDNMTYYFKEII